MRHIYILFIFIFNTSIYSQTLRIKQSTTHHVDSINCWIDIEIFNPLKDTLVFPKYPSFGYKDDTINDFTIEINDFKSGIPLQFKDYIHYVNVVFPDSFIKIPPNNTYIFEYNILPMFPIDKDNTYILIVSYPKGEAVKSNELTIEY